MKLFNILMMTFRLQQQRDSVNMTTQHVSHIIPQILLCYW